MLPLDKTFNEKVIIQHALKGKSNLIHDTGHQAEWYRQRSWRGREKEREGRQDEHGPYINADLLNKDFLYLCVYRYDNNMIYKVMV